VHLASISGGTTVVSCFVLGIPALPVWRGDPGAGPRWPSMSDEDGPTGYRRKRASCFHQAVSGNAESGSGMIRMIRNDRALPNFSRLEQHMDPRRFAE